MARAFTTLLNYYDNAYTAVITQIGDSVSFYVPDESLHHIIPNGRFSYNPEQGLKIDTPKLNPLQNLVLGILDVVGQQNKKQLVEKT
jgi:hypothetical protein